MKIHDIKKFREKRYIFTDRQDAGLIPGSMMRPKYSQIKDGIVTAIPSGGVPVGINLNEEEVMDLMKQNRALDH